MRFDHLFEFGWRYQLCWDRQDTARSFGLQYLWFNFRVYFLEPVRWSGHFPFVHGVALPSVPAGHAAVQRPFGILSNIPVVWLALALPMVGRGRWVAPLSAARSFVVTLVLLFGVCALTLCLFFAACLRYEVEFAHVLVLATCADEARRNGARAVELARAADSLAGGTDPSILDTLAAAYAESGRFGEAVRTAEAAIALLKGSRQVELTGQAQERLKLYQAGRPYHERSTSASSPASIEH